MEVPELEYEVRASSGPVQSMLYPSIQWIGPMPAKGKVRLVIKSEGRIIARSLWIKAEEVRRTKGNLNFEFKGRLTLEAGKNYQGSFEKK